jgi:5'-deoxynucleotidase YfbR-like HD superfamily hydrolase
MNMSLRPKHGARKQRPQVTINHMRQMATQTSASPRKSARSVPPRAWQRMLSGRRLDLLDPSPLDIEIEDIAHGLARVARWNGQTTGDHAFSVAQHSLIVEQIAVHIEPSLTPEDRLMALLHDSPEYVVGDMISPFKNALGLDYRAFEDRIERAVHIRFGLPPKTPAALKKLIKRADLACAFFEATQVAGFGEAESVRFFGAPPAGLAIPIDPWPARQAQAAYLARHQDLIAQIDAQCRPQHQRKVV